MNRETLKPWPDGLVCPQCRRAPCDCAVTNAALKTLAPPEIRPGEWVDALAEKWDRRISELNDIAPHSATVKAMAWQLGECLSELHSHRESASTVGDERMRERPERPL